MESKIQALFEQRKNRIITTCRMEEPDTVPIVSMIMTYAIGYAGKTTTECIGDLKLQRDCFEKTYTDIYHDAVSFFGLNPFAGYFKLDTETYQISRNNVTVQHSESSHMIFDEYDEFLGDPLKYIANKVAYRKLAKLRLPYDKAYENLSETFDFMKDYGKKYAENCKYAQDVMGLPMLTRGSIAMPIDIFFDFIRGFTQTLGDIRRYPELVEKSINILTPYFDNPINKCEEFPFYMDTCHIPTFLSPKQFERFYWPNFKRQILKVYDAGSRFFAFLEGDWERFFYLFEELPKGALIALLEKDDIIKAKKLIGDNVILAGGVPLTMLKTDSKLQCIDYVKKVIDECAPGGGFIASTDKCPLAKDDVNRENYIAVNEFIHEYGKY